MDLREDAKAIQDEMVALRRELHQIPEVGLPLPRTQERVLAALDALPLEVSTGASLTYAQALVRALALGRVLERTLGPAPHVGILIPPNAPCAVANLALALWGKVPINLNYTASQALVDSSIEQSGITHVLTSAKVLDRFKIRPKGTLVMLEDLPAKALVQHLANESLYFRPLQLACSFCDHLVSSHKSAELCMVRHNLSNVFTDFHKLPTMCRNHL